MRSLVRVTLLALLAATLTAPLAAQDIRQISHSPRSGFWWGLGVGSTRAKIDCATCTSDTDNFPTADLHLGATLSSKLTLGLQITGGQKDGAFSNSSDVTSNVGDVNVSVYLYPMRSGNLWLQGGVGGIVYREKLGSNYDQVVGGALVVGAGYDIMIGRHTSITPDVRGVFGSKADAKDQDGNTVATDIKLSNVNFGVSIIWH